MVFLTPSLTCRSGVPEGAEAATHEEQPPNQHQPAVQHPVPLAQAGLVGPQGDQGNQKQGPWVWQDIP